MYQELSAKVDKVSHSIVVNITMVLYSYCKSKSAWDPWNFEEYQKCTKQISASNSKIHENFNNIELFSMKYQGMMALQTEMEKVLEDIRLTPNAANGLKYAISYIKNVSFSSHYG